MAEIAKKNFIYLLKRLLRIDKCLILMSNGHFFIHRLVLDRKILFPDTLIIGPKMRLKGLLPVNLGSRLGFFLKLKKLRRI